MSDRQPHIRVRQRLSSLVDHLALNFQAVLRFCTVREWLAAAAGVSAVGCRGLLFRFRLFARQHDFQVVRSGGRVFDQRRRMAFGRHLERISTLVKLVEFEAPAPPPELSGRVVDQAGRPVAGALLRMAPHGGRATIDLGSYPGFPVWAPRTETNASGEFRLPAPRDGRTVVVFSRRGLADRALTITEIEALDCRVELEEGRTVVVEVRDRNGEAIDGGWSSGMAYLHVRPSVHLGHDVWRDVSSSDHPAAEGRRIGIPYFLFADLATDVVKFRFTYLADDEFLLHDTRFPSARFVSRAVLDELGIGK